MLDSTNTSSAEPTLSDLAAYRRRPMMSVETNRCSSSPSSPFYPPKQATSTDSYFGFGSKQADTSENSSGLCPSSENSTCTSESYESIPLLPSLSSVANMSHRSFHSTGTNNHAASSATWSMNDTASLDKYCARPFDDLSCPAIPSIPGYSDLDPILPHYPQSVSMYRATHISSGQKVFIKAANRGNLDDLIRIRHEWSISSAVRQPPSRIESESESTSPIITQSLAHLNGILRSESCTRFSSNSRSIFLTYNDADPGLITLREKFISTTAPERLQPETEPVPRTSETLAEILTIVIRVVEIITQTHFQGITHNGLTSSSIFVSPKDNSVFISGWDFSFPLKAEDTSHGYRKTYLNNITACLGYVSPETTGLNHRLVDYRSDFYSIGCILYELTTGCLPFTSEDPFELTRMHVLRTPSPPHLIAPWVPTSLSSIILKLMEKKADDRYQTSKLIFSDLTHALNVLRQRPQLHSSEDYEEFVPNAVPQVSQIFLMPQVLYGRENEINLLRSCYKRKEERDFQFIFINGEPGSGKTRLVNELERSSLSRNAFFCSSKFDPYQRGPPFYSIVTVLKEIVHQILCGSVQSITRWRDNILSNLKVELAVLFEPIPELRYLLGHEYSKLLPTPRHLGPVPRELRFKYVVKSLFCLFGSQGLTIFLDDVQWCPQTELDFFHELATFAIENFGSTNGIHIIFVCASTLDSPRYHELVGLARDLSLHYEVVNLEPLGFNAVQYMLNDTLTTCTTSTKKLQTGGGSNTANGGTGAGGAGNGTSQDHKPASLNIGPSAVDSTSLSSTASASVNSFDLGSGNGCNTSPIPAPGVGLATVAAAGLSSKDPYFIFSSNVEPQVSSLSQIVYNVTNGNPLFITLILNYMNRNKLLYYDESNRSLGGRWKVDFESFQPSDLPQSITSIVIETVNKLPQNTITILKYAACICSNSFTLEDLAISAGVTFSEAAQALNYALEGQLIMPTTVQYKFPFPDPIGTTNIEIQGEEIRSVAASATYRFFHDLVQQAVYSLLSSEEAIETHRSIGMRLLDPSNNNNVITSQCLPKLPEQHAVHKIIEIANQLKNATPIVTDSERYIYLSSAVQAGDAVYAMSDFDMAYSYFDTARQILPSNAQKTHPAYFKHIYLSLVELQYNRRNFHECLDLIDEVFDKFSENIDKAALLRTQTKAEYGLYRPEAAITTGIRALNLLGFPMQEDEDWNAKNHAKIRHHIPLTFTEIRGLVNQAPATDPALILAQEVISIMTVPIILSYRPHLFRSLIYTSVVGFVDHGATASCSFSLLSLASLFQRAGENTNLLRAYEYSKLAIVTLEHDNAVGLDFGINIYEYYALTLAIYFEPLSEVIRYYDLVLSSGQTFDNHCGMLSLSYDLRPLCKFLAAEPLSGVLSYFEQMRPVNLENTDNAGKLWIQLHSQAVANILGIGNSDPCVFSGAYIGDPNDTINVLNSNYELKYVYYVVKLILAVIHRQKYLAADIICVKLPKVMSEFPVTLYHVIVTFFGALAIIDKDSRTEQEMELLNQFARDLEDWSQTNPSMFMQKHLLVQAEIHKNTQNSIITLDTYEEAIAYAINEGFINDAALINERCGDYLLQHSRRRSMSYFRESVRLYTLWGAHKRASQITAKFHDLPNMHLSNSMIDIASAPITSVENVSRPGSTRQSGRQIILNNSSANTHSSSPLRWILSNLFREDDSNTSSGDNATDIKRKKNSLTISEAECNALMLQPTTPTTVTTFSAAAAISAQSTPTYKGTSSDLIPLAAMTRYGNGAGNYSSSSGTGRDSGNGDLELKTALQYCLDISEAIEVESVLEKFVNSVMKSSGADYCVFVTLDVDEPYIEAIGILNGITLYNHRPVNGRFDVPLSVIFQVSSSGQLVSRGTSSRTHSDKQFELLFGHDTYFQTRHSKSILCMPIQNQLKVIGVLYIEHQSLDDIFTRPRIELLGLLCTQVVMSLEKAKLYHQMEVAKKTAEEATEEKASFLANMSHEIRTPFNALLSCSIFLLDTKLSEVQREYVEIIRSSAMLTLNIIDAILAFSKIEHGSITLDNAPFSLRECVESAIQLVAEPAATKDLELVHLNKCGDIDIVYGDVTRVRQIIINLVGNAVKFTSAGYIVVETQAEKVSSDNRYGFVIAVKDTGIGIPKSARSKIFRAFSQVDGSSRRLYGGSGLGLAISKKLAELMGGSLTFESNVDDAASSISAGGTNGSTSNRSSISGNGSRVAIETGESEEALQSQQEQGSQKLANSSGDSSGFESDRATGAGTTFWFDFVAVAQKPEDEEKETKAMREAFLKKRVLVVDPFEKARESLVFELERVGFDVECCASYKEAIALVAMAMSKKEKIYSLVFMNGGFVNAECKQIIEIREKSPQTQVVFMTRFGAPIPEDGKEKGIAAILMRPAQRRRLLDIVQGALKFSGVGGNAMSGADGGGVMSLEYEVGRNGSRGGFEEEEADVDGGSNDEGVGVNGGEDGGFYKMSNNMSLTNLEHLHTDADDMIGPSKPLGRLMADSKAASGSRPHSNSGRRNSGNGSRKSLSADHPLKILLAEDNPINTRVALQHLKRMGYEAEHAKDGVEVVEKCIEEVACGRSMYDCILMDIQMPRKDGIAAAQELMSLYGEKERPAIIALTANAAGEDRQNCLAVGMANYIAKPILPADLARVLLGVVPLHKRVLEGDGESNGDDPKNE